MHKNIAHITIRAGLATLAITLIALGARGADLLRFLPNSGNCVYEEPGLLRSWPAGGPRELWRVPLGGGKSAVVESAGRAFTAVQAEGKQWAVCLDPKTGKTLWKKVLLDKENHHNVNGPVTSPIVDGDRVYFIPYMNNKGDVWDLCCPILCLRASDGGVVWREDAKFVATEAATPLIVGDTLYIGSSGKESVLVAVDKRTGKLLWKVANDPPGVPKTFCCGSSLTYQVVDGVPQILVFCYTNDLIGVHAKTGKVMWHWGFPTSVNAGLCSTPVAIGPLLFLSGAQPPDCYGALLRMSAKGGKIEARQVYIDKKLQTNMYHTVSVYKGMVFGFGRGNEAVALQCTDLKTGKLIWQKEGPEWGLDRQLVVAGGRIFAITRQDEMLLLDAARTGYKELGRVKPGMKLGIPQQPTIANGRLYLRGEDALVCYQVGAGK